MHGQLESAAVIRSVTQAVATFGDGKLKMCFQHMGEVEPATVLWGFQSVRWAWCGEKNFSQQGKTTGTLLCYSRAAWRRKTSAYILGLYLGQNLWAHLFPFFGVRHKYYRK